MAFLSYITFVSVLQLNALAVLGIRISQETCNDHLKMFPPSSAEAFNDNDEHAAPKEFPFMARIYNDTHYTNGVLISENFVLSTASANYLKTYVILGDVNWLTDEDDATIQRLDIIDEITHPEFSAYDYSSNIKLFKLNRSVKFNEYVRPVCISQSKSENSQQLLQIGWGYINVCSIGRLVKVPLDYVSNINCTEAFTSSGHQKYVRDINSGKTLCAGAKIDREMRHGFSASALLNKRHEIIGIASYHCSGCSYSSPTLFVRLSSYIDWIRSYVWPNETVTDHMHTESTIQLHITNQITNKLEPSTHKVEITRESSTTKERTKSLELHYIIMIVAAILLILCAAVPCLYFQRNNSRNSQNVTVNVQYTPKE